MNSLISVKHLPDGSCNDDIAVFRRVSFTFNRYRIVMKIIGLTALLLQYVFNSTYDKSVGDIPSIFVSPFFDTNSELRTFL